VQVSTSATFATTVVDQSGITGTSQAVSGLANNTSYYWRVRATNAGGTSAWSSVWSFTTVVAAPGVPVLMSPADRATEVEVNPTVQWQAVTGAVSYQVQVATSSDFGTLVLDQSGTGTSSAVSGLTNNTTYYWRVRAVNAGGTSVWSSVWSFTTVGVVPAVPVLSSPFDGATGISTSPTVRWNAVAGAASYQVQVATGASFATTVVDQSGVSGTSYAVSGLTNNTIYYWRVRAVNAGGTSAWSPVWSFTTIVAAPEAPVLVSPSDGATGVSTDVPVSWMAVGGATSYDVQVATRPSFPSGEVRETTVTGASTTLQGLEGGTLYYWRVRAVNAGG
jgi:hypothetical protein